MLSTPDQMGRVLGSDQRGMLVKRLELAAELALHGPDQVGSQLCAAIFREHAMLLGSDRRAMRNFLACLLLLQEESLLLSLVRACYGFDLVRGGLTVDGAEQTILGFPSGNSLVIPWGERGADATRRRRFAALWSDRLMAELTQPLSPAATAAPGFSTECHTRTAA